MLNTPILFLIFNRPKTTKQVFDKIRQIKPKQLFIAADGPRLSKPNEKNLCEKTCAIIKKIDWECEVKTLFREENLGCGRAVSSAISWFFEHVEEGIILEDDCVPKTNFFNFCEIMLEKYRDNPRVMHVSGTSYSFAEKLKSEEDIYYFSAFCPIWGWATWRRAWLLYEFEINEWLSLNTLLENRISNVSFRQVLISGFEDIHNGTADTWDNQWGYCVQKYDGLCVSPILNMVRNIGIHGAHSNGINPFYFMPTPNFKIAEFDDPPIDIIDKKNDEITFTNLLNRKVSKKIQLVNRIIRYIDKFRNIKF